MQSNESNDTTKQGAATQPPLTETWTEAVARKKRERRHTRDRARADLAALFPASQVTINQERKQ